ncbi:MAG TPA: Ig-like domain-containing protein [Stellaceae bacterium]|nr:Ig-like domain-containing protein [Stellaceae bacterium]
MSYTINNYRANGVVLNSGTQNPTTVTSSGSITNQFYAGDVLYGTTAAAWNITNYGVISTGTAASGSAVHLAAGGTLSNAAGTISGYANGILIGGGGGTVTNSATITGTGITSDGVNLAAGGIVYNVTTAAITGQQFGVYIGGAAGTVDNHGMIDGTGLFGVEFQAGGVVSNASTGVILGGASGVVIYNAPGTVTNYGAISGAGSFGNGVHLSSGGLVANQSTSALITGYRGVYVYGGNATVTNAGTIDGAETGVRLSAGTLSNSGTIIGVGKGVAFGNIDSVSLYVPSFSNTGTISATGTNGIGVYGYRYTGSGALTVTNSGTIVATASGGTAVILSAGGSISNVAGSALIAGDVSGVVINGATGTVSNLGTIEGTGTSGVGVDLAAGGTVVDAGTIIGGNGTAVYLGGAGNNLLDLAPLYALTGNVVATGTANSLELAVGGGGSGTISGLGLKFQNFPTVTVDAGANWVLAGGNTVGAGVTLSDLGTLTDFGSLTNDGVIAGAGGLVIDPASLVNNGYIGLTVTLSGGGYLDNTGTIATAGTAVYGTLAAPTIVNSGTISGIGTGPGGVGLNLLAGGYVTNGASVGASALIAGYDGVRLSGPAGTLVNFGTIESTGAAFGAQALDFLSGGTVTNNGTIVGLNSDASGINAGFASDVIINGTGALIAGWLNGIDQFSGIGTIVNSGTAESTNGTGVYLQAGGLVDNASATAQIAGHVNGVYIGGGSGTISNLGAITGTGAGSVGVRLGAGGYVTNNSGGAIDGGANGIFISGGAATVVNSGAIAATDTATGAGIALHLGGYVSNAAGAAISGYNNGVFVTGAAATVVNSGAIASTGTTSGVAVYLASGGIVTNETGGVLSAYRTAVSLKNSAGSVSNYGRIASAGTYYSGIYLGAGGSVTNQASGTIVSGWNGIDAKNVSATVGNLGMIASTATALSPLGFHGAGVLLQQGGVVVNGYGTATITGYEFGVYIGGAKGVPNPGAAGTIVNHGTIASTGTGTVARAAAELTAGGTINNYGSITSAGSNAIHIGGTVAGTVDNFGLIENFAAHAAIYSAAGGIVTNAAGATITSTLTAISFKDTAGTAVSFGTVINAGRIVSYSAGGSGAGVYFGQGGTLTNQTGGLIMAYRSGISAKGSAAAVTNAGNILSTGNNFAGIYLGAGGSVTNSGAITSSGSAGYGVRLAAGGYVANSGQITGQYDAVRVTGGAGTVANLGIINGNGTFTDGVAMFAGGSVTNGAFGAATALIEGFGRRGVFVYGGLGTVTNFATIQSLSATYVGVYLKGGGSVTNETGGLIQGAPGIAGVAIGHLGGTVTNYGSITGVFLGAGGTVTNQYGGVIAVTSTAITVLANSGTIVNYGGIVASGGGASGVSFAAGGTVANGTGILKTAVIQGGAFGVTIAAGGNVTNYGTIAAASGVGVDFTAGGSNLTNAGTITGGGGTAVSFTGGGNRLIVDPGAVFFGAVNGGGGGSDVVELAPGSGNIGGLGTSITGFDQVVVDPVATWLLSGTNAVAGSIVDSGVLDIGAGATLALANGISGTGRLAFAGTGGTLEIDGTTTSTVALTISGFTSGETIHLRDIAGGNAGRVIPGAGNLTTVVEGGRNYPLQLDPAQVFGGFAVVGDGASGTDLEALAPLTVASGTTVSVLAGQTYIDPIVQGGGTLDVGSNGSVYGTFVSGGGTEIVEGGGFDSGTVLDGAAVQFVSGTAISTTVSSGDTQIVENGGTAISTTIENGGLQLVQSGGVASNTVISGQLVASGSVVSGGGKFELAAGGTASGTITFSGPGGTLQLDSNRNLTATPINGFAGSDAIDLQALPFSPTDTVSFTPSTTSVTASGTLSDGTLTVSGGGVSDTLTLDNVVSGTVFSLADDGAGHTLVTPASANLVNGLGGPAGFGSAVTFSPNLDDGSSAAIDITSVFASGLDFFGTTYTTLFINTNGNISFGGPNSSFISQPLTTLSGIPPIIAPFFADVALTGQATTATGGNSQGTGQIYDSLDTVNHVFTVTWDDVGYSAPVSNAVDAFQLQLIDQGGGNFDIMFRYQYVGWATDPVTLSGPATAGYNDGNGHTAELAASGLENAMLALPSLELAGTPGATATPGVYAFAVRSGAVVPSTLTGLTLDPASDSGIPGDAITNVVQPVIDGTGGVVGDTVRLLDGATVLGTATVGSGGLWSVQPTAPLADGAYSLTATEADASGNVSPASAPLTLRIDTTAPATTPASLTVVTGSAAAAIGIAASSDPDDAAAALTVTITALPGDGTVTLADGTTPVTLGVLAGGIQALTGLDFTAGAIVGSSKLQYTVADAAGNLAPGSATLAVTTPSVGVNLFDFIFTYNDGEDYYFGTVADDGRFAYRAGQTIVATGGTYDIYNKETQTTSDAPGTVRVTSYSHSGPGVASPTPIATAAGLPDGSGGLTSESDAVLGTDGQPHPFSSASEASFPTTALFGFVFTYADGAAFYSGTVADNGSFGTIPGSRTVTDSSGNVLGSYAIFAEGTTALPAGAVVVDRFTEGGTSYIPNGGGTGAGGAALGSETGSITANGTSFAFSDHQEPAIPSAIVPLAIIPAPSTADIVTAELTDLYQEVLNRNPDAGGLATYTAAIDAGTSLDSIRTTIAQSPEAQDDLNQLYLQIFGRNGDPGGLATYTAELIGGASLGSVELLLAQSPEAQSDINQIYQNVLARDADGGGLTTYIAALGQGTSLGQVRGQIAHSPEAQDDLTQLFQQVTGQAPGAAQLAGMEDQIAQPGASQQTVAASLGATTGLAVITAGLGDASLTAQPLTPTLFVFNDIAFGHDTIAGFDAARDTIELAHTLAPDFATVQSELSSTAAGALLTLNQNQSILLGGVAPASLGATNFQFA